MPVCSSLSPKGPICQPLVHQGLLVEKLAERVGPGDSFTSRCRAQRMRARAATSAPLTHMAHMEPCSQLWKGILTAG
ncbi:hypothetical protein AALO_G00153950 [Alosa alosa]|uniref:Uncharacterized protein n=1 Tax=Alosa alosa TaxID=278164 RepID=A0AAV6GER4_9TELE|nr:hypothetical protein AALO_G00153950 [Alosa alosa]